jgi:hypothetical protein
MPLSGLAKVRLARTSALHTSVSQCSGDSKISNPRISKGAWLATLSHRPSFAMPLSDLLCTYADVHYQVPAVAFSAATTRRSPAWRGEGGVMRFACLRAARWLRIAQHALIHRLFQKPALCTCTLFIRKTRGLGVGCLRVRG